VGYLVSDSEALDWTRMKNNKMVRENVDMNFLLRRNLMVPLENLFILAIQID
jgi:hypothetical protein